MILRIVAQGKEGTKTGHQSDAQTPEVLEWQSSLILGTISQSLQVPSTAWQLQGDSRWQKARTRAVDFDEVGREVQGPRLRGPERELSAWHSGETQELTEDDDCTPSVSPSAGLVAFGVYNSTHACISGKGPQATSTNTDRRECQQELVKFPKAPPYSQEMCPTLSCRDGEGEHQV